VPEELGGAGADLGDGFGGERGRRFAIPVPLVETMLAGWLLARAGLASPDGVMTVAPARPQDRITLDADGTLSGRARGVPFAREAQHIAVIARGADGFAVALVPASACRLTRGENLAGDAADTVTFDKTRPTAVKPAPSDLTPAALMQMGAALRSLQIAGALETLLPLSSHPTSASPSRSRSPSSRRCSTTSPSSPAKSPPPSLPRARRPTRWRTARPTTRCCLKSLQPRSAARKPPRRAPPSPTRCTAPSLFPRAHPAPILAARAGWRTISAS